MAYDPSELYVTEVEQEAYDLSAQMALANCRSHVSVGYMSDQRDRNYYVVVCDAPEAYDRARKVRKQMFGS